MIEIVKILGQLGCGIGLNEKVWNMNKRIRQEEAWELRQDTYLSVLG